MIQSSFPNWLQALGAMATLAVTAWLAWLTSRYLLLSQRLVAASRQDIAQALASAKASQIAIGRALLEEVKRIRSELGEPPDQASLTITHGGIGSLAVHAWLVPIIPRVAETDAEVVGLFLSLERRLGDHRTAAHTLGIRRDELDAALKHLRGAERALDHPEGSDLPLALERAFVDHASARHTVSVAQHELEEALKAADLTFRQCHAALDGIEDRLVDLLTAPGERPASELPAPTIKQQTMPHPQTDEAHLLEYQSRSGPQERFGWTIPPNPQQQ